LNHRIPPAGQALAAIVCLLAIGASCSNGHPRPNGGAPGTGHAPHPKASAAPAEPTGEAGEEGFADDESGAFGSLLDEGEFNAMIAAIPPSALRDPPSPVDLPKSVTLTSLPAVAAQGTAKHTGAPGSCEAQSFAYGLGSFTAARRPDGSVQWDPADPANTVSAAYMYARIHLAEHKSCPSGSASTPYLSYLVADGSPSAAEVPYQPKCPYLDGATYLGKTYPDEGRLRIGSFARVADVDHKLPLATLKELLASGQAIAFSGPVLKGYGNPTLTDGVLYGTETVPKSGHGQLVVGYDDGRGSPGKQGALLVQNSFGPGWPKAAPGGRIWISYETFLATQKFAAVAYPRDPSAPSGTLLQAEGKKAPAASIRRAFQWSPASGGAWLVLMHHFAEPVLIQSVSFEEPGGKTASVPVEQYMQSGYTYLRREDDKQFHPGRWKIAIEAVVGKEKEAVRYTGAVIVGDAAPVKRAVGPVTASVTGPTSKKPTVK
jgi:hypothetical protein